MASPFDKFAEVLAPAMRRLSDDKIKRLGTIVDVLRITRTSANDDVFGETEPSLELSMLTNCIIKYPFNAIEIFNTKQIGSEEITLDSVDLMDLLPIELHLQFQGLANIDPNTNKATEPTDLKKGDYVVDHLRDEDGTIMPIILEVERFRGGFKSKLMVKKYCELSLVRGTFETDIQDEIDAYIAGLAP